MLLLLAPLHVLNDFQRFILPHNVGETGGKCSASIPTWHRLTAKNPIPYVVLTHVSTALEIAGN